MSKRLVAAERLASPKGTKPAISLAAPRPEAPPPAPTRAVPRPEILDALESTAHRYGGHPALRRAGLSVTEWQALFQANIEIESDYRPNARSPIGAIGLGQLMPATAAQLGADQMTQLCGGVSPSNANGQALVVGIGTGFNVSQVITKDQCTVCPPAEAGHISMPSSISSALQDQALNPDLFPTVETLFSGRGLTAFCRQFTGLEDVTGEFAINHYGDPGKQTLTRAIDAYAVLLGLLLRDLSLSYMPSHGTFLAGSVGRAIAASAPEPLVNVFHEPCKFRLQSNPAIFVAEEDDAALLGCAQF